MKIAEDSSYYLKVTAPVEYEGLGFDYKWNLGWMNDTFAYLSCEIDRRGAEREKITHSMDYFYQDLFLLPLSHDEVVHGKHAIIEKIAGNYEEKFLQLRSLYLFQVAHPGKKLSFMGNELAEFKEWDQAEPLSFSVLEYPAHGAFYKYLACLNHFYSCHPALYCDDYHPGCFQWLSCSSDTVFCFERRAENGQSLLCVVNFGRDPAVSFAVPNSGIYQKIFSTVDSEQCEKKGIRAKKTSEGYRLTIQLRPFESCIFEKKAIKRKGKLS